MLKYKKMKISVKMVESQQGTAENILYMERDMVTLLEGKNPLLHEQKEA